MAERPSFPKKETEIGKLSCGASMAAGNMRAAAAAPKHNDIPARPPIMMSPASLTNSTTLLPFIPSCQLVSDQHPANPSSILIPNPNPNSICSPHPSASAGPSFRSVSVVANPLNFHNYQMMSSCVFQNAEQSSIVAVNRASSELMERSPIDSVAQPMRDRHHQMPVDDVGRAGRENQGLIGQRGLLAAHAYSPWIMQSWADEEYEEEAEANMAYRGASIREGYTLRAGSEQPSDLGDDRDRPSPHNDGAGCTAGSPVAAVPTSSPSLVEGPPAARAPSSPSSTSASELHYIDDTTASTLSPMRPAAHDHHPAGAIHDQATCTADEGIDAPDAAAADKPPLKKQRRKGQKRVREARVALLTKSEVEHLEDGYRWRKYGQKAVKNSPHPRSYYRCTNSKCFVKKRVERCSEDPSLVVTTYEGQHTHHSPALLRGSINMQPDPNYHISGSNVTFVPWQSSLMSSPNLHFPSNLAHSQPIRPLHLPSPANMLSSFPQYLLSNSDLVPFHALQHVPTPSLGQASLGKLPTQPQAEASHQGHAMNYDSRHNHFLQAFRHDQQQQLAVSGFLHATTASAQLAASSLMSAHIELPPALIDKGLLHDMLPHPCSTQHSSPRPASST